MLLVLVVSLLVIGCSEVAEKSTEAQIKEEIGKDVDVEATKDKIDVKSDKGKVEVTGNNLDNNDWCKEGAEWKMQATTKEGDTNAKWLIKELVTSGEFAGLCHVDYTINGPDNTVTKVEYYFSKDGEKGYMMIDANGQKFKQEWSKK